MNEAIFNSKPALPNKLLQEDGTITDITGKTVTEAVDAYNSKPSLPNKFLNPDGSYSTLNEIIASMIDTDIFVVVDELPAEGDPQKIYIVPNGDGTFNEYRWTGTAWDNIGMIEFDIDNYYTKTQTDNNFLKKTNTTPYTPTENYHPATKKYVDDSSTTFKPFPNTFVTDSTTTTFLASIVAQNLPVGMAYLGQVSLSDMPDGVTVQAEVEVYIYPQNVAYCVMRSADVAPYIWEVNSYDNRGWEPLVSSGGGSVPQVFYWDSVTNQSGIDFWNTVMQANETNYVAVVWFTNTCGRLLYVSEHIGDIKNKVGIIGFNYQTISSRNGTVTNINTISQYVNLTITNNVVTAVSKGNPSTTTSASVLETNVNYGTPYAPLYDGSPATKKYVDDSITTNITNVLGGSY